LAFFDCSDRLIHRVSGEGEPAAPEQGGVGICVSGGGLRAASFGLGALQALQDRRGLLRGPNAARYLSAVSGGSYIAGAYTLVNCGERIQLSGGGKGVKPAPDSPPFAPDSPEAEHLRRHCRYMIEEGGVMFSALLGLLIVLNLGAVALLVAFVGYYLGLGAHVVSLIEPEPAVWLQWLLAVGFLFAVGYGVKRIDVAPKHRSPAIKALGALLALLALAGVYPLLLRLQAIAPLRDPDWLLDHLAPVLATIAAVLAVVAVTALLGLWLRHFALLPLLRRLFAALLTRWLVVVVGVLVVSWAAVWVYGVFTDPHPVPWESGLVALIFFTGLLLPSLIVNRASPHYIYRDRLNRCFSVVRCVDADGRPAAKRPYDPRAIKLSGLKPPNPGGAESFPELLICAAVNVSDVGATPAGSNALSLVFTAARMDVAEVAGASLETTDLERLERPTRLGPGWGPAVNLASAVAMTGAAVSPAMGKRTRADLRALFTLFDARLGVWLPNPLKAEVRAGIKTRSPKVGGGFEGAFSLLRELFGLHSERADAIYVTDGGHYDNLGLVELLRRECEEIWCIDASGDKPGRATALSEALLTASGELGVHVDIDVDAFARTPGGPLGAPVLNATHVSGAVRYAEGKEGKLHVVKLGITERTPSALREYRRTDRRFPHHSTLNQIYRAERFDAYRDLGWASTQEALGA
jgi:hypothetical protein